MGYSDSLGASQMGQFRNLPNSIQNVTNLPDMNSQMNNLRSNVKIPPYAQIVSPGVRVQNNPFNFHSSSSYANHQQQQIVKPNIFGQSTIFPNPVNNQAVSQNEVCLMQNASFTPLSESQKVKLNVLTSRIRLADNKMSNMQKGCFKKTYNQLRDISKYNIW